MTVTASDQARDWWSELLAPGGRIPPVGLLLARHPDAAEMTDHLLADLTVEQLIRIANVEHNRCRLSVIPDHLCEETRAQLAWDLLHSGVRNLEMRPDSAWTETAELLSAAPDSQDRVAQLRGAPIHRLITVCERLVNRPYRRVAAARRTRASQR